MTSDTVGGTTLAGPETADVARRRFPFPARVPRFGAVWWTVAGAIIAVLPAITGIPYFLVHGGRYHPWSDHALIELQVRQIGHHPVLTGPFSREGWQHPGPAMYYLIAGPYHLLADSSAALPLTALLVNAACVIVAALLVRRRFGTGPALVALTATTLYLHLASPGFWRDPWNPNLPVMPFLVMALLCLGVWEGQARFYPVAVGLGSFAMQSHLGFVVPVMVLLGLTLAVALVRPALRPGVPAGWAARLGLVGDALRRRWRVVAATVAVVAVMWALPVGQEIFGHRGNLTLIWDYLRTHSSTTSLWDSVRIVLSEIGAVPGYLAGRTPFSAFLTFPPVLPAWTGLVSLGVFAVAVAAAVRMRHAALLRLAALAAIVCLSAVLSVSRIVGPIFYYLVAWIAVGGVLLWTAIGATVVVAFRRRFAAGGGKGLVAVGALGCLATLVVLAVLSVLTVRGTAKAATPGDAPDAPGITAAVVAWLGPARRHDAVRVDISGTPGRELVDPTLLLAPGIVLDLRKHGVDAVSTPPFANSYGPYLVRSWRQAPLRIVISHTGPAHPPPGAGKLLGSSGGYTVYGGPNIPTY